MVPLGFCVELMNVLTDTRGMVTTMDIEMERVSVDTWLRSNLKVGRLVALWPLICRVPTVHGKLVSGGDRCFPVFSQTSVLKRWVDAPLVYYGIWPGRQATPDSVFAWKLHNGTFFQDSSAGPVRALPGQMGVASAQYLRVFADLGLPADLTLYLFELTYNIKITNSDYDYMIAMDSSDALTLKYFKRYTRNPFN